MECDRFILEKLEGGDSPGFRAHRASCAGCARDVEELGDVRRLYREATEEERWRGGVPVLRRRSASAWIPVAAAAALAAAALAGLFRSPAPSLENPKTAEAPAPFVRTHLAPWDREEHRLSRAMEEVWSRLDRLERSVQ